MAKVVEADGISGSGPAGADLYEIHFANVRGVGSDTYLTVRLPASAARQLADGINASLPKGNG